MRIWIGCFLVSIFCLPNTIVAQPELSLKQKLFDALQDAFPQLQTHRVATINFTRVVSGGDSRILGRVNKSYEKLGYGSINVGCGNFVISQNQENRLCGEQANGFYGLVWNKVVDFDCLLEVLKECTN